MERNADGLKYLPLGLKSLKKPFCASCVTLPHNENET